jgi:DNA-binding MarR family transcriptional regulator
VSGYVRPDTQPRRIPCRYIRWRSPPLARSLIKNVLKSSHLARPTPRAGKRSGRLTDGDREICQSPLEPPSVSRFAERPSATSRRTASWARTQLTPPEQGLTRARAELLWRLRTQGSKTQRGLSEALRCSPRNITGLLDDLGADGLVVREPHPTDRRALLVTMTPKAAKTRSHFDHAFRQNAEHLFAGTSPANLAALTGSSSACSLSYATELSDVAVRLVTLPPRSLQTGAPHRE